jgi:hypothetical protein
LYHNPPVERLDRLAAFLNVVILTMAWGFGLFWAESSNRRFVRRTIRWAFLLAIIVVLDSIRRSVLMQIPSLVRILVYLSLDTGIPGKAFLLGNLSVAIAITARHEDKILGATYRVLFFFLPFSAITLLPLLVKLFAPTSLSALSYSVSHSHRLLQTSSNVQRRVLWLLFDELDRNVAFPPGSAASPYLSIEKIRQQSMEFTAAASPGYNTMESIPALISGIGVRAGKPVSPTDVELMLADGSKTLWRDVPTVFGDAHQRGMETILIGWAHPYTRVLSGTLGYCRWYVVDPVPFGVGGSLWSRQLNQLKWLSPVNRLFRYVERYHEYYAELMLRLRHDFVPESSVLMMAHIPIPHLPSIYDAKRRRYSVLPRSRTQAYINNMALVDQTLTRIRDTLETNGTWDDTLVILSSDHGEYDRALGHRTDRVPYLIKLPGQRENRKIDAPVNTVITRALINAVLEGRIRTADELESWLEITEQS